MIEHGFELFQQSGHEVLPKLRPPKAISLMSPISGRCNLHRPSCLDLFLAWRLSKMKVISENYCIRLLKNQIVLKISNRNVYIVFNS